MDSHQVSACPGDTDHQVALEDWSAGSWAGRARRTFMVPPSFNWGP